MRVFNETQRFNQWWLQLILISVALFMGYSIYKWYFTNEAVGNVTPSDSFGQLIVIVSIIPILILFYYLKLRTEIDESGIHYQFMPFHFSPKKIAWIDIDKCYVRTYNPILEYGGWGFRSSLGKGKAFNVKGNKGIQVELKSGKKILLGTQKENEAKQIIQRYFKSGL
ncbi:MAG: hypothetical protein GY931_04515 [Maribacter sp.]|nr:hypothetical protein [Maribacter sp.]